MNKFRSRLLFGLITLIIVVLVGLGILLGQLFKNVYVQAFDQRIERELIYISTIFEEEGPLNWKEMIERINVSSSALQARVVIMSDKGEIVVDSNDPLSKVDIPFQVIDQLIMSDQFYKVPGILNGPHYYGYPIDHDKDRYVIVLSTTLDSLKKINQQIWGLLITSLGIALIVIIFLGVRITTQYTKPLETATKVAMQLANGNYDARTYEDHLDETGMLSQAINTLAQNLQDMTKAQEMQQDRLRTLIENMGSGLILIDSRGYINIVNRAYKEIFNIDPTTYLYKLYHEAFTHKEIIDLVEEIFMTEVKVKRQVQLALQIERKHFEIYGAPILGVNDEWKGIVLVFHDISELKKLEQMRKDFVANVSHELKTPITSIKGFSETLLDGAMQDEQTLVQFLSIILKESDRLKGLVEDLLELSKIEQQGFELSFRPMDIIESVDEIITMLQSKAKEKQLTIHFNKENQHLYMNADPMRIKQIFINIINNAINYTPENGIINVSIMEKDDKVIARIEDTGVGIQPSEIPRIFERFYRIDKARSRNSGGTGLGLAIVKHLVEAHHGKIYVTSQLGVGTTFTVEFKKDLEL